MVLADVGGARRLSVSTSMSKKEGKWRGDLQFDADALKIGTVCEILYANVLRRPDYDSCTDRVPQ